MVSRLRGWARERWTWAAADGSPGTWMSPLEIARTEAVLACYRLWDVE